MVLGLYEDQELVDERVRGVVEMPRLSNRAVEHETLPISYSSTLLSGSMRLICRIIGIP